LDQLDLVITEMINSKCALRLLRNLNETYNATTQAPTPLPPLTPVTNVPTPPVAVTPYPAKCKIAFRMDSVQEGWLVDTQLNVMNQFLARKVPLTLGVIDKLFGLKVDPSSKLQPWINFQLGANTTQFEIASHGYEGVSFTTYNASHQLNLLKQFQTNYQGASSKLPANTLSMSTFIPPLNGWNAATLAAMRTAGYRTLSAWRTVNQGVEDEVTFYNSCPLSTGRIHNISHFPQQVQVFDDNTHEFTSAVAIIASIKQMLKICNNYAVIAIDFQYFATGGVTVAARIAELDKVLVEMLGSGCSLRLLRHMDTAADAIATEAPTTAPTPGKPKTPTDLSSPVNAPSPATSVVPAIVTFAIILFAYLI
jgi:hypothetical protein